MLNDHGIIESPIYDNDDINYIKIRTFKDPKLMLCLMTETENDIIHMIAHTHIMLHIFHIDIDTVQYLEVITVKVIKKWTTLMKPFLTPQR